MNTYVTLAYLLAVAALGHASSLYGYGSYGYPQVISSPIYAPAAVSTANLWKGSPLSVYKTSYVPSPIVVPVIKTVPIIKTIPVIKTIVEPWGLKSYGYGNWGGYGLGGYGLNGYGLNGLNGGYGKSGLWA